MGHKMPHFETLTFLSTSSTFHAHTYRHQWTLPVQLSTLPFILNIWNLIWLLLNTGTYFMKLWPISGSLQW